MELDQKECSTKVEKLIEKHPWIASEKQLFGRSGTDYDFATRDPRKAMDDLGKLQSEQSGYVYEMLYFVFLLKWFYMYKFSVSHYSHAEQEF